MNVRSFCASVLRTMLLIVLVVMCGCGSDSGHTPQPTQKVIFSNGASVGIVDSGNGNYVVQGENWEGVAGSEIRLTYDPSVMSSPAVVQGDLISGTVFAVNANTPGLIRMAFVSATGISGTGPISAVSFSIASGGSGTLFLDSVNLVDRQGRAIR